jgi:CRP-like cAMP-binding protein
MNNPAPLPDDWRWHPFVEGLSPEQREILARCAMPVHFQPGQTIFREGEPANRFYLVLKGSVALQMRLPDQGVALIAMVGPGEVLGWSWLIPPYFWHFDATCVEDTAAVFFYGTWLRQMAEEHHAFGHELMKRIAEVLAHRLLATRRQLLFGSQSATSQSGTATRGDSGQPAPPTRTGVHPGGEVTAAPESPV